MPKLPRSLGLKKCAEKRVTKVLSALPLVCPEVKIDLIDGDELAVSYNPNEECSLHPVLGAQGFYVDYDAVTRESLEATAFFNRRQVRVGHISYIDSYHAGGARDAGRFRVCWRGRSLYRATPTSIQFLNEWNGSITLEDRLISPSACLTWATASECSGPDCGGTFYSGNAVVRVGDHSFDCVRAVRLNADKGCESEPGEPRMNWWSLDDVFVTPDGRIVLTRRFKSRENYERNEWEARKEGCEPDPDWSHWSTGRNTILYNGFEFAHWYDILTDISLGWPGPPPFK